MIAFIGAAGRCAKSWAASPVTARPCRAIAIAGGGAALLMVSAIGAAAWVLDTPVWMFTRDPATIGGVHPMAGMLSNLGVLGWCAAASIALFAVGIARQNGAPRDLTELLLAAALLTAALMFDDLFLVHEYLMPALLGMAEEAVLGAYITAVAVGAWRYRRTIRQTDAGLLLLALMALGGSLAIDAVRDLAGARVPEQAILIEDGAKFAGILYWCGYLTAVARQTLSTIDRRGSTMVG